MSSRALGAGRGGSGAGGRVASRPTPFPSALPDLRTDCCFLSPSFLSPLWSWAGRSPTLGALRLVGPLAVYSLGLVVPSGDIF